MVCFVATIQLRSGGTLRDCSAQWWHNLGTGTRPVTDIDLGWHRDLWVTTTINLALSTKNTSSVPEPAWPRSECMQTSGDKYLPSRSAQSWWGSRDSPRWAVTRVSLLSILCQNHFAAVEALLSFSQHPSRTAGCFTPRDNIFHMGNYHLNSPGDHLGYKTSFFQPFNRDLWCMCFTFCKKLV